MSETIAPSAAEAAGVSIVGPSLALWNADGSINLQKGNNFAAAAGATFTTEW